MAEQSQSTYRVTLTVLGWPLTVDLTRAQLEQYMLEHAAPVFGDAATAEVVHKIFTPLGEG